MSRGPDDAVTQLAGLLWPKLGDLVDVSGRPKFVAGLRRGENGWIALRDLRDGLTAFVTLTEYADLVDADGR